jgi:CRP-like cAMP-binding protein
MELVVLGQREFAGILDEVPGFARKLLAGLAHRLREADAKSVQ